MFCAFLLTFTQKKFLISGLQIITVLCTLAEGYRTLPALWLTFVYMISSERWYIMDSSILKMTHVLGLTSTRLSWNYMISSVFRSGSTKNCLGQQNGVLNNNLCFLWSQLLPRVRSVDFLSRSLNAEDFLRRTLQWDSIVLQVRLTEDDMP